MISLNPLCTAGDHVKLHACYSKRFAGFRRGVAARSFLLCKGNSASGVVQPVLMVDRRPLRACNS